MYNKQTLTAVMVLLLNIAITYFQPSDQLQGLFYLQDPATKHRSIPGRTAPVIVLLFPCYFLRVLSDSRDIIEQCLLIGLSALKRIKNASMEMAVKETISLSLDRSERVVTFPKLHL